MPISSLNRIRMDRQLATNGAWQHWTGLPEGALFGPWLHHLDDLANPSHTLAVARLSCAREPASPCAGLTRVLAQWRRPRVFSRAAGHLEDGVPHAEALSPTNAYHFGRSHG